MKNITIDMTMGELPYVPPDRCFNWCLEQNIVHSHNLELNAVMIVLFAYFCLLVYYIMNEYDKTRKYAHHFIYYAKLLLLIFLGIYLLVIKMRLIY